MESEEEGIEDGEHRWQGMGVSEWKERIGELQPRCKINI